MAMSDRAVTVERIPSSDVRTFAVYDHEGTFWGTVGYRRHDRELVRLGSTVSAFQYHSDNHETIRTACQLADEKIQRDLLPKTDSAEVEFAYDPDAPQEAP